MTSLLRSALLLFTLTATLHAAEAKLPPKEITAIAKEAYLYAFAPMESYNTWYPQAVVADSPTYVGGFNTFRHYSQAFTAANHDVVTPNNDTPYSWAWLDLRAEPIVISVPEVPKDRYYVLQFIDLFTYNCAYIGSRATGNDAGNYLMVGPKWKGDLPLGFQKVFRSETEIVGVLGRTQLNGPDDVGNVKAVQAGFKLTPLSAFEKTSAPPAPPALVFPPYDKARASNHDFITYLNFLLQLAEPPHPHEVALWKRFAKIGIAPGAPWDASKVDPATLAAIDEGVKEAQGEIKAKIAVTHGSNGLFGSRAAQGENYLQRDVAAAMGLYGNDLEEAWYGGFIGDGNKPGTIHFPKGQLPPAKFFWSLTLYTLPDRFLYDNPLNRYSIGDRTKGLKADADGGLTIIISHVSPGSEKESNWLPAPSGPYSLVTRVYGPSKEAMNGTWKLPTIEASPADEVPLGNPGFESQLSGWTVPAGKEKTSATVSAEAAHTGQWGLRIVDESIIDGVDVESAVIPVSPRQIYTVRFWARCVSGQGVGVYLRFYDAKGKELNTTDAKNLIVKDIPPEPREWKPYKLTGPTPPNAVTLKVAIHSYGKAEVLADFDDFEVTAAAKP